MRPSKLAQAIVAFFLPKDRREEVLGDLYERYRSPAQYAWEAVRVILCVRLSELFRRGEITMNMKTVLAILGAFLCGLTIGIALQTNHNPKASFYPDALPFLALLTLWAILMALKLTHRKPKC